MKTYLDVVNETVEYYKTNPFGYDKDSDRCAYFGPDGEMCAVGRCLNNPELLGSKALTADVIVENNFGGGLKDEYAHLSNATFWQRLQLYHDFLAKKENATAKLNDVTEYATKLDNR